MSSAVVTKIKQIGGKKYVETVSELDKLICVLKFFSLRLDNLLHFYSDAHQFRSSSRLGGYMALLQRIY